MEDNMIKEIRCAGIKFSAPKYSDKGKSLFYNILPAMRESYSAIKTPPTIVGSRYRNDAAVLATLESAASEDEFIQAPLSWVRAALEDCAERDQWYLTEKTYD